MSTGIQNEELSLPLTASTARKQEPRDDARRLHLLLLLVVCLLCTLNVTLAGLCVHGYAALKHMSGEMERVKTTTSSALDQMHFLSNSTRSLLRVTGDMHVAIKNTTQSLLTADRHAHNIVDNTYTMCNILSVGTEKEKACHNDLGYRAVED